MDKVVAGPSAAAEAVADIADGASLAVGGFGLLRHPEALIAALLDTGVRDLETVSQQLRRRRVGPGLLLLQRKRIRRTIVSYVGREQGVRAAVPRRRARGRADPAGHAGRAAARRRSGIPAFYTPAGVGTAGRRRRDALALRRRRRIAVASPAEGDPRVRRARLRSRAGDPHRLRAGPRLEGRPARQPRVPRVRRATSTRTAPRWPARITIAEVEHLVEPGEIDPRRVHTPGIFVQRVVQRPTPEQVADKRIEKRRTGDEGGA